MPSLTKRVVLQVTQGPHAGLYQICGTIDQLIEALKLTEIAGRIDPCYCFDHMGAVELIEQRPHYVLYREIP